MLLNCENEMLSKYCQLISPIRQIHLPCVKRVGGNSISPFEIACATEKTSGLMPVPSSKRDGKSAL
jgi:hypothetical protein